MRVKKNLHEIASEKARSKILNSAQKLFMLKGFAGTSVGEIAEQAKINQSLIYHYFRSKEDLWRDVKARLIADVASVEAGLKIDTNETLSSIVTKLILNRSRIYAQKPALVRMLLWQHLEASQKDLGGTSPHWEKEWIAQIADAQNRGEIAKIASADDIFLLLNAIVWAPILFGRKDGEGFSQRMVECISAFLASSGDYNGELR